MNTSMHATDHREGQVPFFLSDMPTVLNLQPPEGPPEGTVLPPTRVGCTEPRDGLPKRARVTKKKNYNHRGLWFPRQVHKTSLHRPQTLQGES